MNPVHCPSCNTLISTSQLAKNSNVQIDILKDTNEILEVCLFDNKLMKTLGVIRVYPKLMESEK